MNHFSPNDFGQRFITGTAKQAGRTPPPPGLRGLYFSTWPAEHGTIFYNLAVKCPPTDGAVW